MEQKSEVENKVTELLQTKPANDASIVEEARQLKTQLEELHKEIKAEKEKIEKLHAQTILGGKSLLGIPVEKTKEELAKERAAEILKIYGK